MKLNEVFLNRMKSLLKDDFNAFLESLNNSIVKAIYVNENKIDVETFKKIVDFKIEPIYYDKAGFYVDSEKKGRHALHHAGAFYMQEPSAMFTVNSIQFRGDEKVLDMCAAPGGKTIQIANRIPNGILVSNEIVKSRSEILFSNVERMGLDNVIITNENSKNIAEAYANSFDVCFVDAPCSGEGMFRRGSEVQQQWNENLDEMCAARQLEILSNADKALVKNGILVYSTCTYSPKENEEVVREFLKTHNYKLVNIPYNHSKGINMPEAVRLYPHENRGEGQFVAVMQKLSENGFCSYSQAKLNNSSITTDFMKSNFGITGDMVEYKNNSYLIKIRDMIKKNINYVSIGVRLGNVKDKRFEPAHNLFTALGDKIANKLCLNFDDEFAKKYLRGETFDVDLSDGYGAVLFNGCAVGGFKISKGKMKNYYPKGLRNF